MKLIDLRLLADGLSAPHCYVSVVERLEHSVLWKLWCLLPPVGLDDTYLFQCAVQMWKTDPYHAGSAPVSRCGAALVSDGIAAAQEITFSTTLVPLPDLVTPAWPCRPKVDASRGPVSECVYSASGTSVATVHTF